MDLTADVELLFSDWGVPATVGGEQVLVVFSNPLRRLGNEPAPMSDTTPEIWIRDDDSEGIRVGDTITISGQDYTVVSPSGDGNGLKSFKLREA